MALPRVFPKVFPKVMPLEIFKILLFPNSLQRDLPILPKS